MSQVPKGLKEHAARHSPVDGEAEEADLGPSMPAKSVGPPTLAAPPVNWEKSELLQDEAAASGAVAPAISLEVKGASSSAGLVLAVLALDILAFVCALVVVAALGDAASPGPLFSQAMDSPAGEEQSEATGFRGMHSDSESSAVRDQFAIEVLCYRSVDWH
ncbi:unnamed protein product [Symbiodinium sp. CCMP2592]|nr:unnamed protein product [Symbiodinium sp. CCMP2592]